MYSVVIGVQHIERDFVFDTQGLVGQLGVKVKMSKFTEHGHLAYQIEEDEE